MYAVNTRQLYVVHTLLWVLEYRYKHKEITNKVLKISYCFTRTRTCSTVPAAPPHQGSLVINWR
jgi:hypothetical protein